MDLIQWLCYNHVMLLNCSPCYKIKFLVKYPKIAEPLL